MTNRVLKDMEGALPNAAREAWSNRDKRWFAAVVGILIVMAAFTFGTFAETDRALSHARDRLADWKGDARKQIAAEEMEKALALLEKQWPCRAWGPDVETLECTIRELKR